MNLRLLTAFLFISLVACEDETGVPVSGPASQEKEIPGQPNTRPDYLALGDSYTIGQGVPSQDNFPNQLAAALAKRGREINPPRIIAQTGWTSANLLLSIANLKPSREYEIVSLLIGVNNQYQGRMLSEYRKQFTQLLDSAIVYAGGDKNRVVVLSIPDYSVTPFGASGNVEQISREIDQFNEVNRSISLSYGVRYFNITDISRLASADPGLLAPDHLHPSGRMYALWVDLMINDILEILSGSR